MNNERLKSDHLYFCVCVLCSVYSNKLQGLLGKFQPNQVKNKQLAILEYTFTESQTGLNLAQRAKLQKVKTTTTFQSINLYLYSIDH